MIEIKLSEVRKQIRASNVEQLHKRLIEYSKQYDIKLRRKSEVINVADIFIFPEGIVICHFPYVWKRIFNDIRSFSYNIIIEERSINHTGENTGIHLIE